MESPRVMEHVGSLDGKIGVDPNCADNPWVGDPLSVMDGECTTTESLRPIDVSEREELESRKLTSRSYDCDSHAKVTTVSQIDKGYSVGTRYCKQAGPLDSIHQEYYVHQRLCEKERRMSNLSMGSAKAPTGRRERYLSLEEQYEMLKLHHLNLLNEIHETALMLNLFEQRQLIREQQLKVRRVQNLHLVDSSESSRYHPMKENQQQIGPPNILVDEERDVKLGNSVNILSESNKRCMGETEMPNKRQK